MRSERVSTLSVARRRVAVTFEVYFEVRVVSVSVQRY
jgi:hypothetical protein